MDRMEKLFEGPLAAYIAGLTLMTGALSTYWDIATHVDSGRERFLTPPHISLYASVTVALGAVAAGIWADRRSSGAALPEILRHPLRGVRPGLAVAGAGMATALAAAPFDNAWHEIYEIYGIDVTIWSPPHLLAISGIAAAALGLAALVSPAATGRRPTTVFFILLGGVLTTLIITTGEFEFNGPQYRIAYHPMILASTTALVLVAAARTDRFGATRVSLWFEGVRLLSVLYLLALDHSLPFVPLLVPSALAIDLMGRSRAGRLGTGLAASAILVAVNTPLLRALGGLSWEGDDLVIGTIGALVFGAIGSVLGAGLGERLAGRGMAKRRPGTRLSAAAVLLVVLLAPLPAVAHEVGGDAGSGTIEWSPEGLVAGQPIQLRISDLQLEEGSVRTIDVEAWRAEHRIQVNLQQQGNGYVGRFELPEDGPWLLLVRISSGEQNLLSTQMLEVGEGGAAGSTHRERFTLGLDALAAGDPAVWLDIVAYGTALALAFGLLRAVIRSLNRQGAPPIPKGSR